jgi:methionyl-tRNA synthetase
MTSFAITELANALGIEYSALILLLILVIIWSAIWKFMALWKSARKGSLAWFIVLGIFNTLGILEILYIYVFSERKSNKPTRFKKKRR